MVAVFSAVSWISAGIDLSQTFFFLLTLSKFVFVQEVLIDRVSCLLYLVTYQR